jgi:hypothetical protein
MPESTEPGRWVNHWTKVPNGLMGDPDERITAVTIGVYAALCSFADGRGWCCPPIAKVAKRAHICVNTAREHLMLLAELGHVGLSRRSRRGRHSSHEYRAHLDLEL